MNNLKSHAISFSGETVVVAIFKPTPSAFIVEALPKPPEGFMRFGRGEVFTIGAKEVQVNGKTLAMQRVWVPVWCAFISVCVSESTGVALSIYFVDQPRNKIGK